MKSNSISIIGGGCSGILLLIQLIRQAKSSLNITLVNSGAPLARGIAYNTSSDGHLLNVRACRMSAFPEEPLHFVNWIKSKPEYSKWNTSDLNERFVSRKMYGHYIEELLDEQLKNLSSNVVVNILEDKVVNVIHHENYYEIILEKGKSYHSQKVILCTGNIPPLSLPGKTKYKEGKNIFINPWDQKNTENLNSKDPVLVLGSSLTMADTVISLVEQDFQGKIYVLSRHGLLPMEHPVVRPTHLHETEFIPSGDLQVLYKQILDRIRHVIDSSVWHEPVLEELRPHTQKLWQQFPLQQKQQFLRHINHLWSRLRHRIPTEIFQILKDKIDKGQIILMAGELISADEKGDSLKIEIKDRHSSKNISLDVQRLINCTGPELKLNNSGNSLILNLLEAGLIRPCPMNLGYDATPEGKIIGKSGSVTKNMFTMGPGLRGILWESVAVPELRVQAKNLASELLQ